MSCKISVRQVRLLGQAAQAPPHRPSGGRGSGCGRYRRGTSPGRDGRTGTRRRRWGLTRANRDRPRHGGASVAGHNGTRRFGSARLGSARLGAARHGTAPLAWLGSARLGWARCVPGPAVPPCGAAGKLRRRPPPLGPGQPGCGAGSGAGARLARLGSSGRAWGGGWCRCQPSVRVAVKSGGAVFPSCPNTGGYRANCPRELI